MQVVLKKVVIILLSLICLICIIFLAVWGYILVQDSTHERLFMEELSYLEQHETGKAVTISDEDYQAGIQCAKEYNYKEAEILLIRAYNKVADKNSLESAKINQSIGVLYLLTYRFEEASEYLVNSYIAFRDSVGAEEDNSTFTKCLIAYCDCFNGNSERAFADLDDIFWNTHQPEIRFLDYMLTLKAFNELGQYKKAYEYLVLTQEQIADRSNFVPDEFKSPVIPDISIVNYHEILGDLYTGLECPLDARSQYLIAAELLIANGRDFNAFEVYRLIIKMAQAHIMAGYNLNDTCYLINSDYSIEDYLVLLLDVARDNYDSGLYYFSFELAINLAKAFRLSESNDYYVEAMKLVLNSCEQIEDRQKRQFYIVEAKALTEYGYYCWTKTTIEDTDLLTEAEDFFSSAAHDMNKLLLGEHADTAKLYHMVAVCCLARGDFDSAYSSAQHSLQVYEKAVGRNTPQAYLIFVTLGTAEGHIARFEDAFDHIDYALDLASRYYGKDSVQYKTASQVCDDVVDIYISSTMGENR